MGGRRRRGSCRSGGDPATDAERHRLDVEEVVVLRRVRLADGQPVALETAVFPADKVEPVLEGPSTTDRSSPRWPTPASSRRRAPPRSAAEAATAEDARLLDVKRGAPLLVERRLIRDQAGAPLEWTESRYAGSRYGLDVDFEVELPG